MRKTSSIRRIFVAGVVCVFQVPLCQTILAQTTVAQDTVESVAQKEVARRQAAIPQGRDAIARGKRAMAHNDFAAAHEEFRTAVNLLPDAVTSGNLHDEALKGFCDTGVKLAEQRVAEGKRAEAEAILHEVLDDRYSPNCRPAAELLANLGSGGINIAGTSVSTTTTETVGSRTMGPKFLAKVEEVKRLLADAEAYYQAGRYDLAHKKYEQVLALDPYNTAARHGQERLDNIKYKYGEEAYNETRARALWAVEKGWEQPVHRYGQVAGPMGEAFARDATGTARINNKLNTIIIPRIEFRDASIREAIDFIRQQAAANDPATEGKKGVDIVLRLVPLGQIAPPSAPVEAAVPAPATTAAAAAEGGAVPQTTPVQTRPVVAPAVVSSSAISPANARITISLSQIPLGEALRYIASQAGLKVKVEPYAISIIPISEQSNDLITKEYRVPPGFISSSVNVGPSALEATTTKQSGGGSHGGGGGGAAAGATGTAKDTQESTGGHQLITRENAKDFLESQGVPFPPGASANFLPQSSRLVVRNTADNLELVDALVEQASISAPKQVEIESKFIEITQTNLKELGFDWLLGPFNLGNDAVFGSGGTPGTGTGVNPANFPFNNAFNNPIGNSPTSILGPGGNAGINTLTGAPGVFPPQGGGPLTSGNRSGQLAISANAIDALLFPTTGVSSVAPGIFGISGVFTDPQFQLVIRALNQKKGVDLLSAPKVTTKSGQRAVIEIVREFRYPTAFTPPQVPSINGGTGGTGTVVIEVVTPTTPQSFETRNTGVTLEVEPVVGPDGVTVDLNLVPQVVEFEGFINYGSPIFGINPNAISSTVVPQILLTNNVINQPVFSTRKITTSVSVWDGQTVVLGGLMREDVQKTEDRTPILGDLPLFGRLFRTNVDQHIKRNLIIFVTARLVNPAGEPLNATEEEEEAEIQPPALPESPMYKK
jgi:general secretion pathway protein D